MRILKCIIRRILFLYSYPLLRYSGYKRDPITLGLPDSHYFIGEDAFGSLNQIHKRYLTQTGWIESKNTNQSVRDGKYIPWTSYAFIHWIEKQNLENFKILEFGSGASTIYWASRFAFVEAFESDQIWFLKVKEASKQFPNIQIHNLISNNLSDTIKTSSRKYLKIFREDLLLFPELNFDFEAINFKLIRECISRATYYFVDGGPRNLYMYMLADLAPDNAVIFVDNSDQYYTSFGRNSLLKEGFKEIEFNSLGPLNHSATSTSVFFRNLDSI